MAIKVKITKLPHGKDLQLPEYATLGSAGLDLKAAITESVIIKAGAYVIVPTGIAIALPAGYEAQVRPRSGLAAKHGITVLNSPGTIDLDFRGEIKIIIINHSQNDFTINNGERIAQLVVSKYETIEWDEESELDNTERGEKGFGSTGV